MINRFTCFVVVVTVADCMVTVVCADEVRMDECRCGGTGAAGVADNDCELIRNV